MRGASRQELVDQPVAVLGGLLDAVQHRLGVLGHGPSVDGRGDLVEVPADAVERDGVCLDGLDHRAEGGIVLRAAYQPALPWATERAASPTNPANF